MFAPTVFSRSIHDGAHVVHHQPESVHEIDQARAALSACPVAAIRVETKADRHHRGLDPPSPQEELLIPQLAINAKFNGLALPFPRPILSTPNSFKKKDDMVYYLGHHNEHSFGACPYLFCCTSTAASATTGSSSDSNNNNNVSNKVWIMVDTPKFSKSAVGAVEALTGPGRGPDFLFLTHVDDTADHQKWKEYYPTLKRIFHKGDLGRHNWRRDETLNHVEILLDGSTPDDVSAPLQFFTLNGIPLEATAEGSGGGIDTAPPVEEEGVLLVHTPGHSPGSTSLWKRPTASSPGVLFTGDSYSYSTRKGGQMTGFPQYGNNRKQQARMLPRLLDLEWDIVAPGHGHVRDYTSLNTSKSSISSSRRRRAEEMQPALQELQRY
jgi:glyoxylase-like metal-dependent hydrolase (beta-lactamase superfamily II)